jgi:hypothetical protein
MKAGCVPSSSTFISESPFPDCHDQGSSSWEMQLHPEEWDNKSPSKVHVSLGPLLLALKIFLTTFLRDSIEVDLFSILTIL